jgi:hypothetical protein
MKTCPTCRRTYDDDGLNFCLEDGTVLTLSSVDATAPTVVINQPRPTSSSPPAAGIQTSWDAQSAGGAYSMQPKKKSSKAWLLVVGILGVLILLCGGGFAGFFIYMASVANTNASSDAKKGATNSGTTRTNSFTSTSPSPSPTEPANVEEVDLAKQIKEKPAEGIAEFRDGELLIASKAKGYYYVIVTTDDYKTDGAQTRVTVRNPDDADSDLGYGLIFHSDTTPLEKDYAFLIDSKRGRFRVVRHEPEDEITVTRWTNSKLINEGTAENIIEARDKGDKIELYINGQLATTINNKSGPTGGVPGLYSGDGARIGFKKLEIVK